MTFIKIKDFDLVFLKGRWDEGDKFAFIEAIAYCAARGRDYPDWVRAQIDMAMTSVFVETFPEINLKDTFPQEAYRLNPTTADKDRKKKFEKVSAEAIKTLCLKLDRDHTLATRKRAIRDICLAGLVADYADICLKPEPNFKKVTIVKNDLVKALNLSPKEWAEACENGAVLEHKINGHLLSIRQVPIECCPASFDMIDNAWDKHKDVLLKLRAEIEAEHRARQEEEMRLEQEDKRRRS